MILAVDPGSRTCGWAIVAPRTARVAALGTIVLDPDDRLAKTADRKRRAEQQADTLRELASEHRITAIAAEAPSLGGPPAARLAMAIALYGSWGLLTMLGRERGVPVIEVPPKTWQRAVQPDGAQALDVGTARARSRSIDYDRLEAELAAFVEGQASRALSDLAAIKVSMRNHALDAVGVGVYASLRLGAGRAAAAMKGAA